MPRQITLLAEQTPEIQDFMIRLGQQLQQRKPDTQWLLRCLNLPDTLSQDAFFLWSHAPAWHSTIEPQMQKSLATERACRMTLLSSSVSFHILQGSDAQRMDTVLVALRLRADTPTALSRQFALNGGRSPWRCESCSDPECEHRLFTGLLARPHSAKWP